MANKEDVMKAIEVKGLIKKFGDFTAVNSISFDIDTGEIFGFVGPNGSGKSTTIRILCGIMDPSGGTATVLGHDVSAEPERIKEKIGYMSQHFGLYTDLTVFENVEFYAGVYQVPEEERDERIRLAIVEAGLTGREDELAANLAAGYRQRLGLVASSIHNPPLIFLDEPTAGVDPGTRQNFWDKLYDMSEQGRTTFVTTHYMEEAERCTRLGFIYNGEIISLGTPDEVKAGARTLEEAFLALVRARMLD
jgi:ABC-2 type transport system ATP-binding protein